MRGAKKSATCVMKACEADDDSGRMDHVVVCRTEPLGLRGSSAPAWRGETWLSSTTNDPMSRPPTPSQASVGAYPMHHQPQPSPAHSNASTMSQSQSQSQSAGPGLLASLRDSVCERPPANADRAQNSPDFGLFRAGKKLCIRCVCAWRHVRERPAVPESPLAPRDHRRHIACPPPSSNAKLTQLVHPPSYLRHEKMADSDVSLQLQEVSPVFC